MKQDFTKPATDYAKQVAILQERGMVINDLNTAIFYLRHLNYYRLSAYWLPFEVDHKSHKFRPNTEFNDVLNLYIFDRELRLLVLDAIERIEVSVRSQWSYQLGHLHNPHAHLNKQLFDSKHWENNLEQLKKEISRSEETFIKHHRNTYKEELPPVWAVCEVMSLGLLSRWYSSLQPKKTRRSIASIYGIDDNVLQSWLHHLSLVRNICAHHSRLWNREFAVIPKLPKSKSGLIIDQFIPDSRKIYNTLIILLHCMEIISPQHNWRIRLKKLISNHSIPVDQMGFPEDWIKRNIWNNPDK
ncbi:Abi family protein [Gloeocapsa sp. BRSZ]